MTKRRRDRDRRSGRRPAFRNPKPLFLVVCEGAVTERQYLRGYERTRRRSNVQIEVADQQGVPKTLVTIAINRKLDAERKSQQESDDFLQYDEIWCVFDVDDHPGVNDAKQLALANGIELAISNPCFELWLLLHFRECPGMGHRHSIRSKLKKHLRKYDKSIDFEQFKPHCEAASRRAASLDQLAESINEPGRNPTTGVYKLVRKIGDETEGI
jgi:RloB-like protein